MRKKSKQLFSLLIITLLLGSVLSNSAMAKGDRPEKLDSRSAFQTDAGIQSLTALTLKESLTPDDEGSWTDVYGNLDNGYTMVLSGTEGEEIYLDVESFTASPDLKPGDYPFYLDPVRVPTNFWAYWEDEGVDENAEVGTWQALMWQIINGDLPIFYLRVSSTGSQLIDGLALQTQGEVMPARVSGDYPLHTYNFGGQVEDVDSNTQYLVIGITYTRAVTPSLWKDGVKLVPYISVEQPGTPIVIDGCGYVDVTIRLENVYNLYAVDLSLTFDPDFVEVVDRLPDEIANPGINLLPIAPWDSPATAYTVRNIAYNEDDPGTPLVNEAGTIRFIASLLNTQDPITDNLDGLDVATIRLRAKDLGATMLSITGMELSDRDGYLVGVPLTEAVVYPVTTQFTAAGGLELGITRLDASTVQLNWPSKTTDEVETFTIHRSTLPYFTPGAGTDYHTLTNDGSTATFDDPVLGNVVDNYFYTMQITCSSGLESPYAWQVGKFEYELLETETTDFNWVGLVLETEPYWTNAAALAQHIQNNSINEFDYPVSVGSVSKWLPEGQTLSTSTFKPFPINNFSVFIKSAYRIVIDVDPLNPSLNQGSIIWAQVGRLPIIEADTYTLFETETTSLNWILQPLDKIGITKAAGLASDVAANSSAEVTVSAVSNFLASGQSFGTFNTSLPFINNFTTRFGYPYRISINVIDDLQNPVTYPRY